jgi:hypothetical protein
MTLERELEVRARKLLVVSKDKKCIGIDREDGVVVLHFTNGQVFKCSGPIVDQCPIMGKVKSGLLF